MHDWKSLGALAEFPGTLVLEDSRPANEAYPSELLTRESLQVLEPELSQQAAAKGARLYEQEGARSASGSQTSNAACTAALACCLFLRHRDELSPCTAGPFDLTLR